MSPWPLLVLLHRRRARSSRLRRLTCRSQPPRRARHDELTAVGTGREQSFGSLVQRHAQGTARVIARCREAQRVHAAAPSASAAAAAARAPSSSSERQPTPLGAPQLGEHLVCEHGARERADSEPGLSERGRVERLSVHDRRGRLSAARARRGVAATICVRSHRTRRGRRQGHGSGPVWGAVLLARGARRRHLLLAHARRAYAGGRVEDAHTARSGHVQPGLHRWLPPDHRQRRRRGAADGPGRDGAGLLYSGVVQVRRSGVLQGAPPATESNRAAQPSQPSRL